tara:strand:- start:86 stop:625 length:540 start_codon:yes stop_codon:yes gene_type:complete
MQTSDYELRKEIQIVNVVSTAELNQKVNLALFNNHKYLKSNLALYHCGYIKDDTMIGRVTIFGNGKMISVGTKNPDQSFRELKRAIKILERYDLVTYGKIQPRVRNIVANIDFKKKINIEKLIKILPKSMYEPEQFAGLIHRVQGSIVSLIFASGKIVIVGSKSYNELNSTYFHLEQYI